MTLPFSIQKTLNTEYHCGRSKIIATGKYIATYIVLQRDRSIPHELYINVYEQLGEEETMSTFTGKLFGLNLVAISSRDYSTGRNFTHCYHLI